MGMPRRPIPNERRTKTRPTREAQARFRTRFEKLIANSLSWFVILIGYIKWPEDGVRASPIRARCFPLGYCTRELRALKARRGASGDDRGKKR
jgi:hypothetical protein